MDPPVSLVILNWERPQHVREILAQEADYGIIQDILVVNNAPVPFSYSHSKVSIANLSRDFGLRTRWVLGALTQCDCIVFQDDDLVLDQSLLATFGGLTRSNPGRLYTTHGRNLTPDGHYQIKDARGEVEIVLTRACAIHRKFLPEVLKLEKEFFAADEYLTKPILNGEDIFLSYAIRSLTGQRHLVVPGGLRNLPGHDAGNAIWRRPGHREARTAMVHRCQEFFGL